MSDTIRAVLLGVFVLASSVWVGGYVAIAVVARTAAAVLEPAQRVVFFRTLGRSYLLVGAAALLVALGTGAGLLSDDEWDPTLIATVIVAAALAASLTLAVIQARRMTRLRGSALANQSDADLARRVRGGARAAVVLRAAIGLLTLAMIALGSVLAT